MFTYLVYLLQDQPSVLVLGAGLLSGAVLSGMLVVTTAILWWRT